MSTSRQSRVVISAHGGRLHSACALLRALHLAALILLPLTGFAPNVQAFADDAARVVVSEKNPPADIEGELLADRTLAAYLDRFRYHREENEGLSNSTIDKLVRAELPGILKAEDEAVNAVLDQESLRIAPAPGTSLEKRLTALFAAGRYESVIEERNRKPSVARLRTMGDAARDRN